MSRIKQIKRSLIFSLMRTRFPGKRWRDLSLTDQKAIHTTVIEFMVLTQAMRAEEISIREQLSKPALEQPEIVYGEQVLAPPRNRPPRRE